MYEAYHKLGGNSTITELRNKFIKLPLREEVEKRVVDCDIKEHYVENGDDFTASVSFIKRPRKF